MNIFRALLTLALVAATPALQAQQSHCPQLAAESSVQWEEKQMPDLTFCRAVDSSGSELFSLSLARDYPFKSSRSRRAESASINGSSTYWYRAEIATRSGIEARETAIRLADGRDAYFNVQAESAEALAPIFNLISRLSF
ncbi:hypothetical protein CO610_06835 [Lysobacteraceae bacterium NML95-0200]|nr:hypothetical protein CO610_06835 [Xanthomonadaceae bacterium NML95-0200]